MTPKQKAAQKRATAARKKNAKDRRKSVGAKNALSKTTAAKIDEILTDRNKREQLDAAAMATPSNRRVAAYMDIPASTFRDWYDEGKAQLNTPPHKPRNAYGRFFAAIETARARGVLSLELRAIEQSKAGDGHMTRWLLKVRDKKNYGDQVLPDDSATPAAAALAAASSILAEAAGKKIAAESDETE